ncbi:lytic murein transglycosylase [Mesorhizobium sp. B2-3-12]|nr:lytic murein transglycosylase [Mesorhizobium sp. B2-3-12]
MALYGAPLCPAGHLPLLGGDRLSSRLSPLVYDAGLSGVTKLPISPLEGEMSGRTEGGERQRCKAAAPHPSI